MSRRKINSPALRASGRPGKAGARISSLSKPRYVCKAETAMSTLGAVDTAASPAVIQDKVTAVRDRRLSRRTGAVVRGSRLKV
ncbi:hypothetical protein [Marinobacterium rhizophilum]|uniref:Uncharacterized protein n=1 Tax=Marinobacterium rhizophilum TaxID=420402 RepID=A0ABY5HLE2_9GAMM|nr:hypothetical protein [Marinobacterium rhizophilum]UTW11751.1 hypothetical protein KDW95_21275 [Marinobacterium rhizophilum]